MENNIKLHERLATLETQMKSMLENHLPHIEERIKSLSTKFWALIILLVTNLASVIVLLLKNVI